MILVTLQCFKVKLEFSHSLQIWYVKSKNISLSEKLGDGQFNFSDEEVDHLVDPVKTLFPICLD